MQVTNNAGCPLAIVSESYPLVESCVADVQSIPQRRHVKQSLRLLKSFLDPPRSPPDLGYFAVKLALSYSQGLSEMVYIAESSSTSTTLMIGAAIPTLTGFIACWIGTEQFSIASRRLHLYVLTLTRSW